MRRQPVIASRSPVVYAALLILLAIIHGQQPQHTASAQRSLHHWKRDLEHRLSIYQGHRNVINEIIASSIYPARDDLLVNGPVRVSARGNVHFSDLIILDGALRLGPSMVPNAVKILADKTRAYVAAKTNQLNEIKNHLDSILRQLDDPANQFIYKGSKGLPHVQNHNFSQATIIRGTRVFKQAQYARLVAVSNATLKHVNQTDVDRVIDDTYMRNTKFAVRDSKGRPFFEGRKIFWNTVFTKELESGCCGRLQPLDTSRMLLRSPDQQVHAPVLIRTGAAGAASSFTDPPALIERLSARQLYNRHIVLNQRLPPPSVRLAPGDIGLLAAPPPENFIQLTNLIHTHQIDRAEMLKTIVFKSPVVIDEALLSRSYIDSRLVIGVASMPGFYFDLSHDNYLLRYHAHHNVGAPIQRVSGAFVVNGPASLVGGAEAMAVNGIGNFAQFLQESVVSINRPTIIRGPVQFNGLPAMLDLRQFNANSGMSSAANQARQGSTPARNVLIMRVNRALDVGMVNGVRIPQDIIVLPSESAPAEQNAMLALKPNQLVRVRGPRHFANRVVFSDFLDVKGTINDIPMPAGVIPLHLNDFIHTAGYSNLWFADGISVHHMTIQSRQFDNINLSEVSGDAQSLMMSSMLMPQPDGSLLIRGPLTVTNLNLIQSAPNMGLLNGFRPNEVLELNPHYPYDTIYGRKTFVGPVEATDCFFNDINQVANWTNHLIRIDRPNTVQTVYSRLAFTSPPPQTGSNPDAYANSSASPAVVNMERVNVEFYPDNDPANHQNNWDFAPELYLLQQALMRSLSNSTGGRYRVNHVRLISPNGGQVNRVPLGDIVTLDKPFRFADRFTMVGKVEVVNKLQAGRIQSNYPIDVMDLVQFDKYRIPIVGPSRAPIKLNNLVLGEGNQASFVRCHLLNGIPFSEFASTIMSLTKPQDVYSNLVFNGPVSFEGLVRTRSSLNGIKNFGQFAESLKNAKYLFDEGLQCNSVVIKT
jgi:hypothetical protein